MTRVQYRTCPLCEAMCGLEVAADGEAVTRVRGDRNNPFSRGYLCPKGTTLKALQADPDRLRDPLVRRDGRLQPASWDEAFAAVAAGLGPLMEQHGRDAVGVVLGNPTAHHLAAVLYGPVMLRALRTKNLFSASTVDQMPKHVSAGLMWGDPNVFPLPDVDRTDHLLVLGANPVVSNGSLATAPDFPGRLAALRARGGRLVVVDPRRTETAAVADEHIRIRPGTDALWLAALVNVVFAEGLVRLGRQADWVAGVDVLADAVKPFTPEAVAEVCGVEPAVTRRQALQFAQAEAAAAYGRVGAHTTAFGTTASWLTDALNVVTGNFDRPGGVMTSSPAHARINDRRGGRGFVTGRWHSRVKGYPEVKGELPAATLADEMETPGPGQIRAVITHAANPVRSFPNSERLDRAFAEVDFFVAIDVYVNETTRHADVILPAPSPLERSQYDLTFLANAVRTYAHYAPALFHREGPSEEDIFARIALIAEGQGPDADARPIHDRVLAELVEREVADPASPVHGRDRREIIAAVSHLDPADRLVDVRLRCGRFGDGFGAQPEGLSLAALLDAPHGIDLGPMVERFPGRLRTASGLLELAPPPLVEDMDRLAARMREPAGGMVLIGRRQLRSNNSWMHNVEVLVRGKARCTLLVHPEDAARLGLADGASAVVRSRVGQVTAPVEISEDMTPGVVSLPHGWGHDSPGTRLAVAAAHAGVNTNALTDDVLVDPLSGNAVLNGIPVQLAPVETPAPAAV